MRNQAQRRTVELKRDRRGVSRHGLSRRLTGWRLLARRVSRTVSPALQLNTKNHDDLSAQTLCPQCNRGAVILERHPDTPDGRYFVVQGRLWRKSNPALDQAAREALVKELMAARRAVREAQGQAKAMAEARSRVHEAKISLGERGPAWWDDGSPDYNRHMAKNTPYAAWFCGLEA